MNRIIAIAAVLFLVVGFASTAVVEMNGSRVAGDEHRHAHAFYARGDLTPHFFSISQMDRRVLTRRSEQWS
jgi:hypothetical protein